MEVLQAIVMGQVWIAAIYIVVFMGRMLLGGLKGVTEVKPGALLRPLKFGKLVWCLIGLAFLHFVSPMLPVDGVWKNLFLVVVMPAVASAIANMVVNGVPEKSSNGTE